MASKIWGRNNVSPEDWIEILCLEIEASGKKASLKDCCNWLSGHGRAAEVSALSRLKSIDTCKALLSDLQEEILHVIIENVSVRTCIIYFENLAYRAFKFFMPNGNPERVEQSVLPYGIYQGTRFSFSQPDNLIRSAFLFYRNPNRFEPLAGYGDRYSAGDKFNDSNVLRFKEIRHIYHESTFMYQILVGGFVFYDKNSFYLIGAAFETDPGINERTMKMSEIRHVHTAHYILDDDNDSNIIRGIKTTSLRNEGDPAAAVVELERIPNLKQTNWENITSDERVEIGLRPINNPTYEKYRTKLAPENNLSKTFRMMRVRRNFKEWSP